MINGAKCEEQVNCLISPAKFVVPNSELLCLDNAHLLCANNGNNWSHI